MVENTKYLESIINSSAFRGEISQGLKNELLAVIDAKRSNPVFYPAEVCPKTNGVYRPGSIHIKTESPYTNLEAALNTLWRDDKSWVDMLLVAPRVLSKEELRQIHNDGEKVGY